MKLAVLLLLMSAAPLRIASACSGPPSWSYEAPFSGNEVIVVARITTFSEIELTDEARIMESRFEVKELVRGDVPVEGTALEVVVPAAPATPNADGLVFEIACSNVVLSETTVGRVHLLFLQPLADGRWEARPHSTAIPDPSSPEGQAVVSKIRQFASR